MCKCPGRMPSLQLASIVNSSAWTSLGSPSQRKDKPALVPAGVVGTACRAKFLITLACLHVAAASSASGGLSAVPLNFQGERSDRTAGLQAWGHLLGSAVLFNKVPEIL